MEQRNTEYWDIGYIRVPSGQKIIRFMG